MTELLTSAEAAKFLRVSPEQMKIWRRRDGGPCWHRLGPKIIRYDSEDLQDLLHAKDRVNRIRSRMTTMVRG